MVGPAKKVKYLKRHKNVNQIRIAIKYRITHVCNYKCNYMCKLHKCTYIFNGTGVVIRHGYFQGF